MPLHMTCVNIDPEAATVAPHEINNLFSIIIPQKAAATPAVAFKNDIKTGISAPPMRMEKIIPNRIDRRMIEI